ncbi:MAG: tetratricopeptide repeat protein [Niastella sp.]|nr:tetratricopeptide repeat protein [Niastella sp.]
MRRKFYFLLFVLVCSLTAFGQQQPERQLNRLHDKLTGPQKDTSRAMVFLEIADHYYMYRKSTLHWLDSLLKYSSLAFELGKKTGHKTQWDANQLQATAWLACGNYKKAMETTRQAGDSNTVIALWRWGAQYSELEFGHLLNYDSAWYFLNQALLLSEKVKSIYLLHVSHAKLAHIFCRKNDTLSALSHATKAGLYYKEPHSYIASMWYMMGIKTELKPSNFSFKMACYERSLANYLKLGNEHKSAIGRVYMSIGDIQDQRGQNGLAMRSFLEAERLMLEGKDYAMFLIYSRLYDICYFKGDFNKAVYYALEALKSAEASGIKNISQFYIYAGNAYYDLQQPARCIEYYNKAIENARSTNKLISGTVIKRMARTLIATGKPNEALAFVQNASQEFIAPGTEDSIMKFDAMGICYTALGQYAEAEKYFLRTEAIAPGANKYYRANCPYSIGMFYYNTRQYDKAASYLNTCMKVHKDNLPVTSISDIILHLYRIDSIRGQHQSAMTYFRLHKAIDDSIFNVTKNRQVEELRVQYDTERKDKELKLQEKDIELLTRQKLLQQALAEQKSKDVLLKQQNIDLLKQEQSLQAVISDRQQQALTQKEKELVLKQKNINLLNNQQVLQGEQLKQANFIKRMTIGGIALLLAVLSLLFNQYRIKQRNNRTISEKNNQLNELLGEKEGLLEEKEGLLEEKQLLLTEIHHRVKNNLQVILSLLKLQSANLKDEALAALNDSQHRVQAMSLIHQRLYHGDNISTINMQEYIHELVDYLKDSFISRTRIVFILNIEPVVLDVSQAVPLGLIINEAVTNIFKHAFPDRERGQVHISLEVLNKDELELNIVDNGVGLPANPAHPSKNSLGLKLMKGLSRDFNGQYTLESRNGTHIQIIFNRHIYEPTASSHLQPTSHDA